MQSIKQAIEDLLRRFPVSFTQIECLSADDGMTRFCIKTDEPDVLIGRNGLTLLALNHVVRRIVERDSDSEEASFIIDVNDYQKKKLDDLKQKAKMMAERARFFKSSVELEPMSSYERMIIHSFIEPFEDLTTESVGAGADRRIVIRYKEIGAV